MPPFKIPSCGRHPISLQALFATVAWPFICFAVTREIILNGTLRPKSTLAGTWPAPPPIIMHSEVPQTDQLGVHTVSLKHLMTGKSRVDYFNNVTSDPLSSFQGDHSSWVHDLFLFWPWQSHITWHRDGHHDNSETVTRWTSSSDMNQELGKFLHEHTN